MFNINTAVQTLRQLKHDKVHGISDKPKQHNPKVKQVDDIPFDMKAIQEHTYMLRRFHNNSADFGKRLSKRKGQYHRPGGGYAGHTIKGA